ncbi:hypothetical protein OAS19_06105 [Altererythrobacter sp.]|nr:hypothetical protein [Altererythrobacter sp.]
MALTTIALIALTFLTWKSGGPPEKRFSMIVFVWAVCDYLHHLWFGPMTYQAADYPHFIQDSLVLFAFGWVMLKANRNWPIVAVGGQLVVVVGHLSATVEATGMQRAYWMMTQLPVVVLVLSLTLGTLAHVRRQRRVGPYRSWSY